MPTYRIQCRVTLAGAAAYVQAENAEDALTKAKSADWDEIEYVGAELVDWVVTSTKPEKMSDD